MGDTANDDIQSSKITQIQNSIPETSKSKTSIVKRRFSMPSDQESISFPSPPSKRDGSWESANEEKPPVLKTLDISDIELKKINVIETVDSKMSSLPKKRIIEKAEDLLSTYVTTEDDDDDDEFCKEVHEKAQEVIKKNKRIIDGQLPNNPSDPVKAKKKIKVDYSNIDKAYSKLLKVIDNKEVNLENIVIVVIFSIQIASKMLNTSKKSKIELATYISRKFVDDFAKKGSIKTFHTVIDITIPLFVHTVSATSKMCSCCPKKKEKEKKEEKTESDEKQEEKQSDK